MMISIIIKVQELVWKMCIDKDAVQPHEDKMATAINSTPSWWMFWGRGGRWLPTPGAAGKTGRSQPTLSRGMRVSELDSMTREIQIQKKKDLKLKCTAEV